MDHQARVLIKLILTVNKQIQDDTLFRAVVIDILTDMLCDTSENIVIDDC